MAGKKTSTPNVCMFKEDEYLLKNFVSRSGGPCIGDLFGLWTDADNEPVVHLVTGPLEKENRLSEEPSEGVKHMRTTLRNEYRLPRIGKWVYQRDLQETRKEIADAMRAEKGLFVKVKTPPKFVLLIMVSYDKSTSKMQLSPYFVSKDTISTKGTIEFLRGENVFLKVEKIRTLTGSLAKHVSGRQESESDPELSQSDKANKDSPSGPKGRELPPPPANGANSFGARVQIKAGVSASGSESGYRMRERDNIPEGQTYEFRVFIYENDIKMMEELVLQYPDVETGGDLFGLWTEDGAVMHIVLGPGKDCRRTDVSFNQDIPYLRRNGELLTEKYMLCHIGEWHSHHQLRLFQPSHGDSSTVIRNYPRDVRGFILIIANIYAPGKVKLSPYLYTQESRSTYDKTGEVIPLKVPNAFKGIPEIKNTIEHGKETELDVQHNRALRQQHYSTSVSKGHYHRNQSPTRAKPKRQGNTVVPMDVDPLAEPMEVDHPNNLRKNKQSTGRP